MSNFRKILGYLVKLCLVAILLCCCIQPDAALAKTTSTQAKPLVTQEIRYHLPEAGEVFLVWGVNGWNQVPAKQQPPGTTVKNRLMYTPMLRNQDNFAVKLQVPTATKIDYLFQITKARRGDRIVEVWDNNSNKNYHTVAVGGVTTLKGKVSLAVASAKSLEIPVKLLPLRIALIVVLAILSAYGLMQLVKVFKPNADESPERLRSRPNNSDRINCPNTNRFTIAPLAGMAYQPILPDSPSRLDGDEPGYEGLAYGLLNGSFFQWPGRTPVYPVFIAGCYLIFGRSPASVLYVQTLVGAAIIPLTFMLARRFTGPKSSLVAAALIAIHPSLLFHPTRLYPEGVYTLLLLIALLGLLWALEKPVAYRFNLAGAMLAITNLCRPTTMLFPLLLPLLMPPSWNLKRKIGLFAVYVGTIVMLTAPWTYHNYRTYNTFLPYSVSTGLLWQGSPEYYHLLQQKRTMLDIWTKELNPKVNGGHDPFTIEGDRYFSKRGKASILAEPGIYIWYCLQKAVYFWVGNPGGDWPHHAIFSVNHMRPYFSPLRITGIFAARLLPLVALAGLIVLRRRWQEFLPLIVVCGYFTALHAITYGSVRHSEPLYPIVVTLVAAAAGEIQRQFEAKVRVEN